MLPFLPSALAVGSPGRFSATKFGRPVFRSMPLAQVIFLTNGKALSSLPVVASLT